MYLIRKKEKGHEYWSYIEECSFRGLPDLGSVVFTTLPCRLQVFHEKSSFEHIKAAWPTAEKVEFAAKVEC